MISIERENLQHSLNLVKVVIHVIVSSDVLQPCEVRMKCISYDASRRSGLQLALRLIHLLKYKTDTSCIAMLYQSPTAAMRRYSKIIDNKHNAKFVIAEDIQTCNKHRLSALRPNETEPQDSCILAKYSIDNILQSETQIQRAKNQ